MELEQRVEEAKLNKEQKEEIIRDYTKFIRARASNTMKMRHWIATIEPKETFWLLQRW